MKMWPWVRKIFPGSLVGNGLSRQRRMREMQRGGQNLTGEGNETKCMSSSRCIEEINRRCNR